MFYVFYYNNDHLPESIVVRVIRRSHFTSINFTSSRFSLLSRIEDKDLIQIDATVTLMYVCLLHKDPTGALYWLTEFVNPIKSFYL